MQDTIDISLIILNYRNKRMVQQCVHHMMKSAPRCSFEILVVDNASGDDSVSFFREQLPSEVQLIENPRNGGFAYGNNIGLRTARGRYRAVVNPDIILSGGTLDRIVEFMDAHPQVGIAGPKLVNPDKTLQYSATRFPAWYMPIVRRTTIGKLPFGKRYAAHYFMKEWDHQEPQPVEALFGAFLVVRAEALETVGYLDEGFFMYMEDLDWCWRFWENHWEVWYLAHIPMIHFHARGSNARRWIPFFDFLTRQHIRSWYHYLLKYHGRPKPTTIDPHNTL